MHNRTRGNDHVPQWQCRETLTLKPSPRSDTYEQNSEFGRQPAYEMGILMKQDYIGELF